MNSHADTLSPDRRRVAIVGGGVSGIACSWELLKLGYTVDMFESEGTLGGHANSVPFRGNGLSIDVDTGFIAWEQATYPRFSEFLSELGVPGIPTDMSFSVSTTDKSGFGWSSHSVWTVIGSYSNLLRFEFWRLLFEIVWFALFAPIDMLFRDAQLSRSAQGYAHNPGSRLDTRKPTAVYETLGAYLERNRYSTIFIDYFLLPMLASPWCTDPKELAQTFPVIPMIQFMLKHNLLDTPIKKLHWQSFKHGSKVYIDAAQQLISRHHRLYLNSPITQIERRKDGVILRIPNHESRRYDQVVLAIPAKHALTLLGDHATDHEREILGCFRTTQNTCYLHSDTSFLPSNPRNHAAWNCLLEDTDFGVDGGDAARHTVIEARKTRKVSVTFDMNKLQAIPFPGQSGSPGRVLVTMNPVSIPEAPQAVHRYDHPLLTFESLEIMPRLREINGTNKISFAGAWMGFGFHEDGFSAGIHAAQIVALGHKSAGPLNLVADTRKMALSQVGLLRSLVRLVVYAFR
ncbi:FAD/NAD(P)-binding domain-containing protein [Astrocystis sublimbata]|nr:FAD/NAD(P)-binding domain-containing protein [Astrocystis sublimbata]KAI0188244.1 FAD/NAD(P)-binding domain-containing protein [Astrocystis sublimbata]